MAEVQWIKIYIDMFDKRKIKKLRRLPAGNDLLLIWIMLLATAGKCNAGGMIFITESVPFTEEDLADELGFEVNTIKLALKAFEELDMISFTDDGFINVIGWEEYQNVDKLAEMREQTRKRVAKCRENKRLKECNVTETLQKPLRNAIEEERDEDKEKESHSIIHSADWQENYVKQKVDESLLEGKDAEIYKEEIKDNLKMECLNNKLSEGIIFMSTEQFGDLCDKLSIDEVHHYFEVIKDCERKGKKFKRKTHYQAILDMAAKDRKIQNN